MSVLGPPTLYQRSTVTIYKHHKTPVIKEETKGANGPYRQHRGRPVKVESLRRVRLGKKRRAREKRADVVIVRDRSDDVTPGLDAVIFPISPGRQIESKGSCPFFPLYTPTTISGSATIGGSDKAYETADFLLAGAAAVFLEGLFLLARFGGGQNAGRCELLVGRVTVCFGFDGWYWE